MFDCLRDLRDQRDHRDHREDAINHCPSPHFGLFGLFGLFCPFLTLHPQVQRKIATATPRNDTIYAVILNAVKNLEVSVAVDGSTSLEILRYTQDDIESERLPRLRLAMTVLTFNALTFEVKFFSQKPLTKPHSWCIFASRVQWLYTTSRYLKPYN